MSTILVVDDDDQVRSLLRRILQREGHEVREAADGQAAIDACRSSCPDLLIMDLVMPGKEGLEAIQEIRQQHPAQRILAISGGGAGRLQSCLQLAKKLGAGQALAKPFGVAELVEAVKQLLADQGGAA
jgi:CheY-like chemotaxis protein